MELLVISILHVLVNFCNWPCKSLKSYSFSPIRVCPWCLDLSVFLLTKACPSRSHQSSVTTFGISYLGLGFGKALNNLNLMLSVLGKPWNIEFFPSCNWSLCCVSLMGGLWVKKRYLMFCGILLQTFFPLGPISMTIYGVLSSLIFSAYIIYDTDNLIKRYTYDEFIWASVALYLDVINLFLSLLEILRSIQSDN